MRLNPLLAAILLHHTITAVATSIPDADVTLKQWRFDGSDWKVLVEEPRYGDDDDYSISRCNTRDDLNYYYCVVSALSITRDATLYNRECAVQAAVRSNDGFLNDVRISSIGNGNKVISLSAYRDAESKVHDDKVEMNRVNMKDCTQWERNKVINVKDSRHEVISYRGKSKDTFDFVIKTARSYENAVYFKLTFDDAGQTVGNASIAYEYEQPRSYDSFDVYPIDSDDPSRGYYFVYDFGDVVKVFSASANGTIRTGRNVFKRNSATETYRDVRSVQADGMVLLCGHVSARGKVNVTCTLLSGESLAVRFNRTYDSVATQRIVGSCVLESSDVVLASVDSRVGNNASFSFDRVHANGTKSRLLGLNETACEQGQTIEFGRIYETTKEVCFSTYCRTAGVNELRKWNVRCFNKTLLVERGSGSDESQAKGSPVRVVYVTSNALIFAIVGFQIILYVILYVIPGLSKLMRKPNEDGGEMVMAMQTKWPVK